MANKELEHLTIEAHGVLLTQWPTVLPDGEVMWNGEVRLLDKSDNPVLTIIHLSNLRTRKVGTTVCLNALEELIGRLLGFSKAVIAASSKDGNR